MTALIVTEECCAETIAVTITKKMQHIYFPCSYSPRYIAANIPVNMLNHHSKTTQVKMNLPHFLDFICCSYFLRRQLSQRYVRQTRNKFAAPAVSFKRIWHSIPTSTCQRVISSEWLIQTSVKGKVQKSFQNCSASVKIASSPEVTRLFLVKLLFDYSKWIDQFPDFRIQPQTIRGSWE